MSNPAPPLVASTGKRLTLSHFLAIGLGGAACASLFFLDKIAPDPVAGSAQPPPLQPETAGPESLNQPKITESSSQNAKQNTSQETGALTAPTQTAPPPLSD